MFFFFYILFLILLLFTISLIFNKIEHTDKEKNSSFECGFENMETSRIPFSMHFFKISLIFIIFDIEIVLILPIILILDKMNFYSFIIMMMIMLIILAGLFFEWNQGSLEWV